MSFWRGSLFRPPQATLPLLCSKKYASYGLFTWANLDTKNKPSCTSEEHFKIKHYKYLVFFAFRYFPRIYYLTFNWINY